MSAGKALNETRRGFLRSAGIIAGGLVMPGLAGRALGQVSGPRLRDDGDLPDPDFTMQRPNNPFLARTRPHRNGGVRLELEAVPTPSPKGLKQIIHNYGHSGAGITLSWGCAAAVVGKVDEAITRLKAEGRAPSLAVLGTGVIGLTSATEIKRKWPQLPVTIYAKSLDVSTTTSYVAGGQFEPSIIGSEYTTPDQRKTLYGWLKQSRTRIEGIQNSGGREKYGVAFRFNYTLDQPSSGFQLLVDGGIIDPPDKGLLPFAGLGQRRGLAYKTWLMNPTLLLPQLVQDLDGKVGRKAMTFQSKDQVLALNENIIVNCTGFGAGELFGDPNVRGLRGHLVILKRTQPKHFYFLSGGCSPEEISYVFCRQNDIVVGGSALPVTSDCETLTDADKFQCMNVLKKAKQFLAGNLADCNNLMELAHSQWQPSCP